MKMKRRAKVWNISFNDNELLLRGMTYMGKNWFNITFYECALKYKANITLSFGKIDI